MSGRLDDAVRAVLNLHCKQTVEPGDIIGPYCAECTSPTDGGPELYPCLTVKTVLDSVCGHVVSL